MIDVDPDTAAEYPADFLAQHQAILEHGEPPDEGRAVRLRGPTDRVPTRADVARFRRWVRTKRAKIWQACRAQTMRAPRRAARARRVRRARACKHACASPTDPPPPPAQSRRNAGAALGRWATRGRAHNASDASAIVVLEFHPGKAFRFSGTGTRIIPCPADTGHRTCVECRLCLDADRFRRMNTAIALAPRGPSASKARAALLQHRRRTPAVNTALQSLQEAHFNGAQQYVANKNSTANGDKNNTENGMPKAPPLVTR